MTLYEKLSEKLQKFSIMDFALVKSVYLIFGILITASYPPFTFVSAWFYLALSLVASAPLLMFFLGFKGNLIEKAKQYLAKNNPSNQVLTLISCFSFGIVLAIMLPILTNFSWYSYIILMLLLAVKPIKKAFFSK